MLRYLKMSVKRLPIDFLNKWLYTSLLYRRLLSLELSSTATQTMGQIPVPVLLREAGTTTSSVRIVVSSIRWQGHCNSTNKLAAICISPQLQQSMLMRRYDTSPATNLQHTHWHHTTMRTKRQHNDLDHHCSKPLLFPSICSAMQAESRAPTRRCCWSGSRCHRCLSFCDWRKEVSVQSRWSPHWRASDCLCWACGDWRCGWRCDD